LSLDEAVVVLLSFHQLPDYIKMDIIMRVTKNN